MGAGKGFLLHLLKCWPMLTCWSEGAVIPPSKGEFPASAPSLGAASSPVPVMGDWVAAGVDVMLGSEEDHRALQPRLDLRMLLAIAAAQLLFSFSKASLLLPYFL